jgi:DNA repair protein SbcC/Rad50
MIPLQVTIEGFLSYKEKQVINFDGSSLWVLWGPNGVGKSAVFDAITFALYNAHRAGKGTRSIPKDLINHHANKLIVTFDFIVNGVIYRVKRTHPKHGRPTRDAFIVNRNDASNPDDESVQPIPGTDSDDGFNLWVKQTIGLDYAAFTASVLLLQGKSEQLLEVDPGGRYAILAELIDLSRYQKLSKAADIQRQNFRSSVETLATQLASPSVRAVSDEEITNKRSQLEQAETNWRDAQETVEQLTRFLEQARHWEADTAEREKQQTTLLNEQALLAREEEITSGFTQLQELQQILPIVSQIIIQQTSIIELQKHIAELQSQQQRLNVEVLEAGENKETAEKRVTETERIVTELQGINNHYLQRLTKIGPLVTQLEHIEQLQTNVATLEIDLAKFPPDIVQQLADAEQQVHLLEEIERVLPWLRNFSQERINLAQAVANQQATYMQMVTLHSQIQEQQHKLLELQTVYNEAQETERQLLGDIRSADKDWQDVQQRLNNFEDAATKPVCDLCGQAITAEHVQREKVRLQQQIDESRCTFEKMKNDHQIAHERQQNIKQELTTLDEQIGTLKNEYRNNKNQQQNAQKQAEQHTAQLRYAFDTISVSFQIRIVAVIPANDKDWLATIYPTEIDLSTLQKEAARRATEDRYLQSLRQRHNEWQILDGNKMLIVQQLEQLTAVVNVEVARKARSEKNDIEQKQRTLVVDIGGQLPELAERKTAVQEADRVFKGLERQLQQCQNEANTETARIGEMRHALQTQIVNLPTHWQSRACSLKRDDLQAMEQKRTELLQYHPLHDDLTRARQSVTIHKGNIENLNQKIAAYPPEAARPAVVVEQELNTNKVVQREVGNTRDALRESLIKLKGQQQQRQELEQQKREAERLHHLYDILARHLGKGGLQLYLLSRAENAIVELANQTLSGLSHGRMRLELRRDSDAQVQTEKALDLVVHDKDTGEHPIPIGLVSGSQKFRIAVSLALAIGRRTSHEARHIESVIIDEGFGSLDKAGRDDMIQELSALGQQLSRIILVSHQEEFAHAFPNRYSFKLVDGTSHVTLMEEE